jgi:DNA-directed RNA polymerase specialized sigma24 family protein
MIASATTVRSQILAIEGDQSSPYKNNNLTNNILASVGAGGFKPARSARIEVTSARSTPTIRLVESPGIGTMMDSEPSSLVTMVLDSRAFGHQFEAFEHFVPERFATLVELARRLLDRYRIADPAFGADDAVQAALLTVFQALNDGTIDSLEAEEDLLRLFRHKLRQVVLNESKREHTCKRGGSGAYAGFEGPVFHRVDADLETIDAQNSAPEAQVSADDQVESLLRILDIHDPDLRVVATMKAEGYSLQEIATRLDQTLSAVEYRGRLIRGIIGLRYPDLI